MNPDKTPYRRRPFPVTVLSGLVLIFTGMQVLRVWMAVANWTFLNSLPLNISPAYFVVSGLVWSAAGIAMLFGLVLRKKWARPFTFIGALAFAAVHWLDRLFLQERGPQAANMPFDLLMTILLLTFVFVTFALPQSRVYLGAKHG